MNKRELLQGLVGNELDIREGENDGLYTVSPRYNSFAQHSVIKSVGDDVIEIDSRIKDGELIDGDKRKFISINHISKIIISS